MVNTATTAKKKKIARRRIKRSVQILLFLAVPWTPSENTGKEKAI